MWGLSCLRVKLQITLPPLTSPQSWWGKLAWKDLQNFTWARRRFLRPQFPGTRMGTRLDSEWVECTVTVASRVSPRGSTSPSRASTVCRARGRGCTGTTGARPAGALVATGGRGGPRSSVSPCQSTGWRPGTAPSTRPGEPSTAPTARRSCWSPPPAVRAPPTTSAPARPAGPPCAAWTAAGRATPTPALPTLSPPSPATRTAGDFPPSPPPAQSWLRPGLPPSARPPSGGAPSPWPPPGAPSLTCSGRGPGTTDTPPTPAWAAPGTGRTESAPWTSDKW